jgi:hypothetical protein
MLYAYFSLYGAHGRQVIAMHCKTTCIAVSFLGDNNVSKLHKGTERRTNSRTRSSQRRTANKETLKRRHPDEDQTQQCFLPSPHVIPYFFFFIQRNYLRFYKET